MKKIKPLRKIPSIDLHKIIEEWVGEEKKHSVADILMEVSLKKSGYNQAIKDLKSRIPQLTERINKDLIDGFLTNTNK